MAKILILTAERTGTGHKSSANAIEKHLKSLGHTTMQVNCFEQSGYFGKKMEASYIPLTTKHPNLWKVTYSFSQVCPWFISGMMYTLSNKNFERIISEFDPDLIITVHGMFTRAISRILRKMHRKTPFMIDVIDLVHPPVIWRDKRADRVFLPTEEIKNEYIDLGFSPDKLVVSGFPIREDIIVPSKPKKVDGKVNILMVNPSINLRKNKKFLLEVSSIEGANITLVCGRDERLYNMACALKEKYNLANVEVVGFIKDMNRRLSDAHILLTKAGPNMILEGARSGTAIVVTGHIPGQEANNYLYVTENDFGIKCENPKKIAASLRHMIEHDLDRYLANVLNSKCNDGAHIIAEAIDQYLKEVNGKK